MDFNEYQEKAMETANYPSADYPFICLGEEAGEVQGKIAKYMRKHKVNASDAVEAARRASNDHEMKLRSDLVDELGDALWEIALCAEELDIPLDVIGVRNIRKLASRKRRGVIDGSGDDR